MFYECGLPLGTTRPRFAGRVKTSQGKRNRPGGGALTDLCVANDRIWTRLGWSEEAKVVYGVYCDTGDVSEGLGCAKPMVNELYKFWQDDVWLLPVPQLFVPA